MKTRTARFGWVTVAIIELWKYPFNYSVLSRPSSHLCSPFARRLPSLLSTLLYPLRTKNTDLLPKTTRWIKTQLPTPRQKRLEHNSEADSSYEQNSGSLTDPAMVVLRDSIAISIWGDNN
ncbi:uncharacterized protein LOC115991317 [Quercus lobata]|uniref:uncharacterized protein LOC115991317 n=1 Tax=Quercus lobata TaxID=97700 RepID=UPI0012457488|nr:uncharacterized protein LOC115991317 [Quercus lobata]